MQFISFTFLAFLFGALFLYYVTPDRARKYILLFVNFIFYYSFGFKNISVLYGMIVISYLFGIILQKKREKKIFIISIVITLLPLVLCKYHASLIEPIGISFFTFKMISYLADTYQRKIQGKYSIVDYMIYVSFFPAITSGPIDRPESFMKQIHTPKLFEERIFMEGFLYLLWGYFQKLIIADRLSVIVNQIYGNIERYYGFPTLATTFLYTFQIYFDFAGYTYIAIGLARMFGYHCIQNFMQPYFATSIRDFWQRWHISLSTWLRDYVYIPLGGNRKGNIRKQINLLLTFVVSGIWHGTGWNYLIWGVLHGIYQVVGNITNYYRGKIKQKLHLKDTKLERGIQVGITFLLVNIAWIFFRSTDGIMQAFSIMKSSLHLSNVSFWWIAEAGITKIECIYILFACIVVGTVDILKEKKKDVLSMYFNRNIVIRFSILYILIGSILVMGAYGPGYDASAFIYFQF